jgi:type II restriction enzyme
LKAQITLEIKNEDKEILHDFEKFIKMVLGIDAKQTKLILPAALYRVGVTNAADRGLDMWANFGAAVQVKHLTLKPEVVEEIAENITADRIVIVCLDAEREAIASLLKQVGWAERIQGIITLSDLDDWYKLCLSKKYRAKLGGTLLKDILREFEAEFPSSEEIEPFLKERGYVKTTLPVAWKII